MSNNKTIKNYRRYKWTYFLLSLVSYFVPYIVVTACLLPLIKTVGTGTKVAIGMAVIVINALPVILGAFKSILVHYPMLSLMPVLFLALSAFFTMKVFQNYVSIFCWIEFAVVVGSIISTIFWYRHRVYKIRLESAKTNKGMGLIK